MWSMSPIEVAMFDLEGGVSVGAADIRLPKAHFHVRRGKVDFCWTGPMAIQMWFAIRVADRIAMAAIRRRMVWSVMTYPRCPLG